ncbi:MAG: carboxymuconolactone decarboxylase family protein [Actinomycetes bacterium]
MKGKKKDKKKQMSEAEGSVDPRRALGMAKMREVYGFEADPANMEGRYLATTVDHLFGDIWQGPELNVATRRLITIGAIAALGEPDLLDIQFSCALRFGELSVEQVREIVLQLTHYVGWPKSTAMSGAAERAIANYRKEAQ